MSKKAYPQEIAEKFISAKDYLENLIYIKNYESFFIWCKNFPDKEGGYYLKLEEFDMLKLVLKFCEAVFPNQPYSNATLKDIISIVKLKCVRVYNEEDDRYISFKDCLLNVETLESEKIDKTKICIHYLDFNYSEIDSPIPNFEQFLNSSLVHEHNVFQTDANLVALIQEMFGMFLLNNLKASTAFFLFGEKGSNGKSILQGVIRNIFGDDFCSSLSLSDFSDKFSTVGLIGKKVNLAHELDEKFGNSRMFKARVSGDYIKAEYKFGGVFQFRPKTKYVFSTNTLPTFDGLDGGLLRRVRIVPFYRQFKDTDPDKDHYLEEKLKAELPGIVGWMIKGAQRFKENKFLFTPASASLTMTRRFEQEMSSALMFIGDDNWEISTENNMPRNEFYRRYIEWSQLVGKKPMSRNKFYRDLENVFEGLTVEKKRIDNNVVACYNLWQVGTEDDSISEVPIDEIFK